VVVQPTSPSPIITTPPVVVIQQQYPEILPDDYKHFLLALFKGVGTLDELKNLNYYTRKINDGFFDTMKTTNLKLEVKNAHSFLKYVYKYQISFSDELLQKLRLLAGKEQNAQWVGSILQIEKEWYASNQIDESETKFSN
jgi:hypothetical protein